jgi:hypothetical protein
VFQGSGSSSGMALVEAWDGSRWTIQSTPGLSGMRSYLNGVACTSAKACTAVGNFQRHFGPTRALVETWNGFRWSTRPTPPPPGPAVTYLLNSVSCISATQCTTVGEYYSPSSNGQTPLAETQS